MTDAQEPKYATGGIIRRGELGPLLDEGGCSYVIPSCCRHCILGTCVDPCHAQPGGIITFHRQLTDEEHERIAHRWRWAIKEQGAALRILNDDGTGGRWSGPRPPWWKRAYYRVRGLLAAVPAREDVTVCLVVLGVIGGWIALVFLFASGFSLGW